MMLWGHTALSQCPALGPPLKILQQLSVLHCIILHTCMHIFQLLEDGGPFSLLIFKGPSMFKKAFTYFL